MVLDYRARARQRPLRDLRLETTVSQTNTATLLPAGPDLQLASLISFDGSCALEPEATGELFLDATVTQTNTAQIVDSATLTLDAPIPFTATCALVEDTPELELRTLVAQANTCRIASQLRLQSTVSQTNRATLRGNLALRAPISMTNSAQLTGTLPADVVLVPSTIDHTGATCVITNFVGDPTRNLQAFIDTVAQGSEIRFPVTSPAAKYRMDSALEFDQLFLGGYQFNGQGATLQQPMQGTITDGVITGGTTLTSQMATFQPHITGTLVTGTGIPGGTTVTYVSAHVVTLSNASTNGSGRTVNVNPGFYTGGELPAFWDVQNCNGMTWRNLTMLGGNITAGAQPEGYRSDLAQGFHIRSCRDLDIGNVTVRGTFGDFVYLASGEGGSAQIWCNGRIHDCTFSGSGRQGLALQGVDRVEIDHNTIGGIPRSVFDFEPNGFNQMVLNVEVHHNHFGGHRLNFLAASGGIRVAPIRNINIHDNTATSDYRTDLQSFLLLKARTTGVLSACTYDNGTLGFGATLTANANGVLPPFDGIVVKFPDVVLVGHEANRAYRGAYRVTSVGSASTPWVLTRWTRADTAERLQSGLTVFIESGVTQAHTGWRFVPQPAPFIVGTSDIVLFEFPSEGGPYLPALTRSNFRFVNNSTTQSYSIGGTEPAIMGLAWIDGVEIRDNVMPVNSSQVRVASLTQCTNYIVSGNTGTNLTFQLFSDNPDPGLRPLHGLMNGVTFDDDSGASATQLAAQELALNRFPKRPIVRLVCDPGQAPSQYSGAVSRFRPYADILIMPADSTALKAYTKDATTPALRTAAVAAYKARFETYLDTFDGTVDMFEAGNELGGGWTYDFAVLGKEVGQNLVADMVEAAHASIKAHGQRSMVCLWENNWGTNLCGAGTNRDESPQNFSLRLSATMRHEVDYLMISWYPTQCGGRSSNNIPVAEIKAELESLHLLYPNARIGFGEVGLPNAVTDTTLASAQSIATYYYELGPKLKLPYYDGAYFWWYAQEDAVPVTKPMWQTLADAMGEPHQFDFPVGFAPGAGLPTKVGSGFTQTYPELDAMKLYGAQCVRLTYGWDAADPTHNGSFVANTALRDVISYCNTVINLPVILTLSFSGTAPWQNHIYSYIPQYAACAVGCAAFFDGTVGKTLLALELGNEPNHDKADEDVIASQKGDRYAQILIRVFDPLFGDVRAVNPNLDVIVGGLGGEQETGNGVSSFTFTQDVHGTHTVAGNVINVTLNSHYDGWNTHPYCYYTLPEDDTSGGWDNLNNIMAWFESTYGDTPPLWVTEMGHPTDEHDNGTSNPLFNSDCLDSANALQSACRLLDESDWDVRSFCWFSFMNNNKPPGPGVGHDNHFGIVLYDADFVGIVPKLHVAAAFSRVASRGNF